jgi:hypothetical protein
MVWWTILGIFSIIVSYIVKVKMKEKVGKGFIFATSPKADARTVEQVREEVVDIINQGEKLLVKLADEDISLPEQLGSITRDFFSKYAVLESRHGGFRLALADVHVSEYIQGYISIGHCDDWEILQEPYRNEVFLAEGGEACFDVEVEHFSSIYHLILNEVQPT